MQRDSLELLVVLARLEGQRKRQIVGGGGKLDTGGDELVSVRRGAGDDPGLRLVRNRGVQGWGFKGGAAGRGRARHGRPAAVSWPATAASASGRLDGPRRARRLGRSGLGRAHGLGPIW
jgi:hypothetical protein